MDILKKLHNTAQQVAREGLEKLGVTLPPAKSDSAPRDLFEVYRRFIEKTQEQPTPVFPLPQNIKDELSPIISKLCVHNDDASAQIESWMSDRKSIIPSINNDDCSLETAQNELLSILRSFSLVLAIGDHALQWTQAAQEIARAQKRPATNLIFQASKQFDADNFTDWMTEMNSRIERFGFKIISPFPNTLSLSD